jgi:RsiW-degrading membrane proteinase PrsW (M82 family)
LVNVLLGLVPVLAFLAVLILMDSFKLVPLRIVLRAILWGGLAAFVCFLTHGALMDAFAIPAPAFSRYVAPLTEELAKALYVAALVRRRRVGFLVDAAVQGFAVGAGFALVENVHYLLSLGSAGPFLWIVRGFGTAIIHGSTTSVFGMASQGLAERRATSAPWVFLPGGAIAVAVHSLFNYFILHPLLATALLLALLPLLMAAVFERSRAATRAWLSEGFHGDSEFLGTILSGEVG